MSKQIIKIVSVLNLSDLNNYRIEVPKQYIYIFENRFKNVLEKTVKIAPVLNLFYQYKY